MRSGVKRGGNAFSVCSCSSLLDSLSGSGSLFIECCQALIPAHDVYLIADVVRTTRIVSFLICATKGPPLTNFFRQLCRKLESRGRPNILRLLLTCVQVRPHHRVDPSFAPVVSISQNLVLRSRRSASIDTPCHRRASMHQETAVAASLVAMAHNIPSAAPRIPSSKMCASRTVCLPVPTSSHPKYAKKDQAVMSSFSDPSE